MKDPGYSQPLRGGNSARSASGLLLSLVAAGIAAATSFAEQDNQLLGSPWPPVTRHFVGTSPEDIQLRQQRARQHVDQMREKLAGAWFAALVPVSTNTTAATGFGRFGTLRGLLDFIADRDAIVETWTHPEGSPGLARRLSALAPTNSGPAAHRSPTFITLRWFDPAQARLVQYRVEFGFEAADTVLAADRSYRRHRQSLVTARKILGARDGTGRLDARAQWQALIQSLRDSRLSVVSLPMEPDSANALFVACEFEVDEFGHFTRVRRFYREDELALRIVTDSSDQGRQILWLRGLAGGLDREATAYRTVGLSDTLAAVPNPVPGQDQIELRVRDPVEADVRRWNVVEFGEPELVRQTALAQFSLVNAHLDRRRRELRLRRFPYDVVAETVIAGLNIGGGVTSLGFPAGETARLAYDLTLSRRFIPAVPTPQELRELLWLTMARTQDPTLDTKPAEFLDEADLLVLHQHAQSITEAQVQEWLAHIREDDIEAMLRLARFQRIDAKVANWLSIVSDAARVSGTSETGLLQAVFNNPYFSVTGEVSLNYILAACLGYQVATPLSDYALDDIARGQAPAAAWLQFLNVTVDLRSLFNTISALGQPRGVARELHRPFPYAPRLGELAAYEIRIFGFPLLMFYKHGLLRRDYEAYTRDYAYGVIGTRLVEHFPTQESLDGEIRAGRMTPIGYVRVPSISGGWTDTRLVVFAHHIPSGRHRGKTALVLYGLKAYAAHSKLLAREYERFRTYDDALNRGGVIRQLLEAQDRASVDTSEFEPRVEAGPHWATDFYAPVLGSLLEIRRAARLSLWNVPLTENDRAELVRAEDTLTSRGILIHDPLEDGLVEVDRHFSRFVYRSYVDGCWRIHQVTLVPSPDDIDAELAAAEEARQLAQWRRAAQSPGGAGIALLHQAAWNGHRFEAGPLLRGPGGQLEGYGVRHGAAAMESLLGEVDRLAVVERARLEANGFAATVLTLDANGDGETEPVFLTVELPVVSDFSRASCNALTGNLETRQYDDGHLTGIISDDRIVIIEYDAWGAESHSRVQANLGTRAAPRAGPLIAETRTLEVWHRDDAQFPPNPTLPRIRRLLFNHVTGQLTRETFGLMTSPLETVDDQFVTQFHYSPDGRMLSAISHDNGCTPTDLDRPRLERVLEPRPGRDRFALRTLEPREGSDPARLAALPHLVILERRDLVRGLTRTLTYDPSQSDRLVSERIIDTLAPGTSVELEVNHHYRGDFASGLIPCRSTLAHASTRELLAERTTIGFDPATRLLTVAEKDYRGQISIKIWDPRWESPVLQETAGRQTVFHYNREETELTGSTKSCNPWETVHTFAGTFDPASGYWHVQRQVWHRPEIPLRIEQETWTSLGRLIFTRVGDQLDGTPDYDTAGREVGMRWWHVNSTPEVPDQLLREEDDFQWHEGERTARVQTWVDGRPHRRFHSRTDGEGRVAEEIVTVGRSQPMRTLTTFEGDTERRREVQLWQGGQLRHTRRFEPARLDAAASWVVDESVQAAWGLRQTNVYQLVDPFGRSIATVDERGWSTTVTHWHPGTPIPGRTELRDPAGQLRERTETHPHAGIHDGLAYDLQTRRQLSPWGQMSLMEETALLSGTDIVLFVTRGRQRTFYDLDEPFPVPHYSISLDPEAGMTVDIRGSRQSQVTEVFGHVFDTIPAQEGSAPERVLKLLKVDLRGLFSHRCQWLTLDIAGNILNLADFTLAPRTDEIVTAQSLMARAQPVVPIELTQYFYDAGWLVDTIDPQGGRMRIFQRAPPAASITGTPVNQTRYREWVTRTVGQRVPESPRLSNGRLKRTTHHPRVLEYHPHLPDRQGHWSAWTATDFGPGGTSLSDTEEYYDGQGELTVSRTRNLADRGQITTRIRYRLPAPTRATWRRIDSLETVQHTSTDPPLDLVDCDFLYLYTDHLPTVGVRIADRRQRTVRVDTAPGPGSVSFWPAADSQVKWLPDPKRPIQAVSVSLMPMPANETARVISVHDLARVGVDIRSIVEIVVVTDSTPPAEARVTPVYRLNRGGPFIQEREPRRLIREFSHPSGILAYQTVDLTDRASESTLATLSVQPTEWTFELDGRELAKARSPGTGPGTSTLDLLDRDRIEGSTRLYQLSMDSGRLLELYRGTQEGLLYLIPQGFQVPRLEIREPGVLANELAPGIVAYGAETVVTVPLAQGGPGPLEWVARAKNRIAANAFQQAAPAGLATTAQTKQAARSLVELNASVPRDAAGVADAVHAAPALAAALWPRRPLPWSSLADDSPRPVLDKFSLQRLAQAHLREADQLRLERYATTGLIPTAPGTAAEPFVDTVAEAGLIQLAVRVRDLGLAKDLLSFYWEQTRGGTEWVHACYDARTGAARQPDPRAHRPLHSVRTAEAQTALAEAALTLWAASGDPKGFILGSNLLAHLCLDFRGPQTPRGINELPFTRPRTIFGSHLWPEPTVYSTRSNARAYLLLRQLTGSEPAIRSHFSDADWNVLVSARDELRDWLATHLVPRTLATGVVPQGVFEIQGIAQRTTALAAERWTTSEDWLRFLEISVHLGVDTTTAQRLLEHLARAHGVSIRGHWGLDWTLALSRPDLNSTELTARFARVALGLGHNAAADFALRELQRAGTSEGWPMVWTDHRATAPMSVGPNQWIWPKIAGEGWPVSLLALGEQLQEPLVFASLPAGNPPTMPSQPELPGTDVRAFFVATSVFYGSILGVALFWTVFRWSRIRWQANLAAKSKEGCVPETVIVLAEERWANRVLGTLCPAQSVHTRYSNATVESNFQMQLRAIHKLVVEWRRRENRWPDSDRALADGDTDDWLNGLDEFCSLVGLYMRWVIKAGAKDGFRKPDPLQENEDSNHIWARLVLYFAEYHWALLTLLRAFDATTTERARTEINAQITLLLNAMGLRQRAESFDARQLFNAPTDPEAFDLLLLQQPGMSLALLIDEAARRLRIPRSHFIRFIRNYRQFKQREQPYPLHPFLIETAKVLPHFLLMAMGALIFYNHYTVGDSSVVRYIWEHILLAFAFVPEFRCCGLILALGLALTCAAHWVRIYRWEAAMLPRSTPEFPLDRTLTALVPGTPLVLPLLRPGYRWNPNLYRRAAWVLRSIGCLWLGIILLRLPTPSFVTFLVVKGILAMLAFAEAASILLPAAFSCFSRFVQDWISAHPNAGPALRLLNQLNLTATVPTSLLWQSIRFHLRPAAPSGTRRGMVQGVVFYFIHAATFFGIGVFLCQEMLPLWFTEKYRVGADFRLLAGGVLFWFTMYLLRYGLFLLAAGVAAWFATFPIKAVASLLAATWAAVAVLNPWQAGSTDGWYAAGWWMSGITLAVILGEGVLARFWFILRLRLGLGCRDSAAMSSSSALRTDRERRLAVVYMSGDALSAESLTPELLVNRWRTLRDRLDSPGLHHLDRLIHCPGEEALLAGFKALHATEQRYGVTMWHPVQLVVQDQPAQFPDSLGLNLTVATADERKQLLTAWQIRRWLATMMSTAGHSQDTGINLVDIALRLDREGIAGHTVFYLIQNKYDSSPANRPAQAAYDRGELGQREKLARLVCALAPGTRAYNLQNWTPFGFKAGALTSMDLVPEESLRLTNMLILDRNATVHDLDGLMADIHEALQDPNLVIVIPGRSTTNTRTPIGQASQMVEEGHRSFLRGLVRVLGGDSSECLGTGWGNLMAYGYGEVQRALLNVETPLMPLTSRLHRGTSFRLRLEGLIGFGPHAVGISEDTWAVSQAVHNAVAFGRRVRFAGSRAMWHKIRETWSHSEWLNSFPRWSGGYFQMMHDPLMQRINDFGPLSVFARELRACSGRFYLSALITLLNILLLPLAIFFDVTPFVQILIVLWNVGFIINQVLTVHSLLACLASAGFHRIPALGGGVIATGAALAIQPLHPLAPAFAILGVLVGGFAVGLGRWLATRLRDVILFGPQLVLHALGQCVRQTLEFAMSGASPQDAQGVNMAFRTWVGPREDRPLAVFAGPMNLKVVVWGVGMISLLLNLIALSRLDLLNVLMLLPSLLFSVSALAGPFLMTPLRGRSLGGLEPVLKAAGWLGAFLLYFFISRLLRHHGPPAWLGVAMLATPFLLMAYHALRFAFFRPRLARAKTRLTQMLISLGLHPLGAAQTAGHLMQSNLEDIGAQLNRAALPLPARSIAQTWIETRLRPLLRAPLSPLDESRRLNSRWISVFSRSFALAWFVLLWFFLVPVPGLFVVSAGAYRIGTPPETMLLLLATLVGGAMVLAGIGGLWDRFLNRSEGRRGLIPAFDSAFQRFTFMSCRPNHFSDGQLAELHGLFVNMLLYLDQRADAYARDTLCKIQDRLARHPDNQDTPRQ